ncbi:MAG: hypothetical protein WC956_04780 [bacterium]
MILEKPLVTFRDLPALSDEQSEESKGSRTPGSRLPALPAGRQAAQAVEPRDNV